ncbi:MAG: 8-oxo-dGTP diphosphatase [Rhodothermales bacterium]|jgi:8-oxo-dGTP diphosphatase
MILATLCYVRDHERGKTLMLHRIRKDQDIHAGKWNGLGGKFEDTETPEDCVIREIEEESGLIIRDPALKGLLTFPKFKDDEDWYVFVYVADDFSGELLAESAEGVLGWIDDDAITSLNLWEGDHFFLPWLEENAFFSASFVYKGGEYISHRVVFH